MKATKEQSEFLIAQFGAVRFAYNRALQNKRQRYKRHDENVNAKMDIKPLLSVAKNLMRYHWFNRYESMDLSQDVFNLDTAFKNFFLASS